MSKKRKYNKDNGRSYEYDKEYQSTPEQKKRRTRRNRDRRRAIANGEAKVGDNTDVHHQNSKNMTKPVVISRSKNRAKH